MDKLIRGLENFNLDKNKESFEDYLDEVIGNLNETKLEDYSELDSEQEWERLSQNYLKLKYIDSIIHSEIVYPQKFDKLLNLFLETMDEISQYYLQKIDWLCADDEIKNECLFIQKCLAESLNIYNGIDKLKKIIEAYNVFIPLIEDFRRELVSTIELDDYDFVQDFSECKRRKIN